MWPCKGLAGAFRISPYSAEIFPLTQDIYDSLSHPSYILPNLSLSNQTRLSKLISLEKLCTLWLTVEVEILTFPVIPLVELIQDNKKHAFPKLEGLSKIYPSQTESLQVTIFSSDVLMILLGLDVHLGKTTVEWLQEYFTSWVKGKIVSGMMVYPRWPMP